MKKMFWMSISREALFSDACLVLIVAGLVCATVRWFHMCAPYSDNEKVYYPARRQMSLFFALPVLLVPYVLKPSEPFVVTYAVSGMDYLHIPRRVGSVSDIFQMGTSRQVLVEKDSQLV